MRILVIGKNGQLGKSIYKVACIHQQDNNFIFAGRNELDLSNNKKIREYFDINEFDTVINCAAYTSVDKAESDQALAYQINHLAVGELAKICFSKKMKLIHISTDYLFDGKCGLPYSEKSLTNPINVYGKTKKAGEASVRNLMENNAVIIRTGWLYSEFGHNFFKTMLRISRERKELSVVSDQFGSPTYATDLAKLILRIIDSKDDQKIARSTETYHYTNTGGISWYDFAKEIIVQSQIDCKIIKITTDQYPTSAKRPKNSVMSNDKVSQIFNVQIQHWKDSLKKCIETSKENL